ncbi:MAG: hypothetical protein WAN22_19580 [Solirubrobacteraceae bacterium]
MSSHARATQPIDKQRPDGAVAGVGVAPEFIPKRNSELTCITVERRRR